MNRMLIHGCLCLYHALLPLNAQQRDARQHTMDKYRHKLQQKKTLQSLATSPCLLFGDDSGYSKTLFEEDAESEIDNLCCVICLDVVKKALVSDNGVGIDVEPCGHIYCEHCIQGWFEKKNDECPHCRQPLGLDQLRVDMRTRRRVWGLQCACPYKALGCVYTAPLGRNGLAVRAHKETCQFAPAVCTWKGCTKLCIAHELEAHQHKCNRRLVACTFCGEEKLVHEELPAHYKTCKEYLLPCPNGCQVIKSKAADKTPEGADARREGNENGKGQGKGNGEDDKVKGGGTEDNSRQRGSENDNEAKEGREEETKGDDQGETDQGDPLDIPVARFSRSALPNHLLNECPFQLIPCTYARYGCREQILRKDLKSHLRSNADCHVRETNKEIRVFQSELRIKDRMIAELQAHVKQLRQGLVDSNLSRAEMELQLDELHRANLERLRAQMKMDSHGDADDRSSKHNDSTSGAKGSSDSLLTTSAALDDDFINVLTKIGDSNEEASAGPNTAPMSPRSIKMTLGQLDRALQKSQKLEKELHRLRHSQCKDCSKKAGKSKNVYGLSAAARQVFNR